MTKLTAALVAAGLFVVAVRTDDDRTSTAQDAVALEHQRGDNRFVAGGSVRESAPVKGDLLIAGGGMEVAPPVGGDVIVGGGSARVLGDVGYSVYAAGGELTIAVWVATFARPVVALPWVGKRTSKAMSRSPAARLRSTAA